MHLLECSNPSLNIAWRLVHESTLIAGVNMLLQSYLHCNRHDAEDSSTSPLRARVVADMRHGNAVLVSLPVDSALALVPQQPEAFQEALPEVLEQRPVDGLQTLPGCSIHRHVQLCDGLQIPASYLISPSHHISLSISASQFLPLHLRAPVSPASAVPQLVVQT